MFDAIKYFRDKRINYAATGENIGPGWVGLDCPFCKDTKKHLGFNLEKGTLFCWRCGKHSLENYIMLMEGLEYHEACVVVMEYENDFIYSPLKPQKQAQGLGGKIVWPPGIVPLQSYHKAYLYRRRYDADYLEHKYQLQGTISAGPYASRIMAPIILDGNWVSYQGRDITGQAALKYKACKKELELIDHTTILYNLDNCPSNSVIVVEGLPDVWRLGDNVCATFGTSVNDQQIFLLAKRFQKVFLLFDPEPEAQRKAMNIVKKLNIFGIAAINVRLSGGDPGDLSQEDADKLTGELLNETKKEREVTVKVEAYSGLRS